MKKTVKVSPEFLTVNQVCDMLQLSRPTIYELFKQGRLTKVKFGDSTRIRLSEVQNIK